MIGATSIRLRLALFVLLALGVASGGARAAHAQEDAPAESPAPEPDATGTTEADQPTVATDASVATDATEADDATDMGDLETLLGEQVVTTASRSAERASAAPATVVTIDGDTIRRYGMRSIDEALGYLGLGTFVADSGRDYTSGVDTGVQGVLLRDRNRHVLVLLDGHVMNAQSSGETRLDAALGVPLEVIDHVEVMLGPGSVSYGTNAMMGVINVVTRRARDYGRLRLVAEGTLSPPLGAGSSVVGPSGADHFGGRVRLGAGFARAGTFLGRSAEILVHGEWQQEIGASLRMPYINDSRDVAAGQPGWGGTSNFTSRSPSAYLRARLGDATLWLGGSSFRRSLPLIGTFDTPSSHEQVSTLRGELRHDVVLTARASLASRLYGDHVRAEEQSSWLRSYYCLPGQQVDGCRFVRRNASSWVGLEEQLVLDWNVDGRFVTTIGGDLRYRASAARPADYFDRITGDAPYTATLPYWRSRSVLGAVFVQQVMRFSQQWVVNLGARFDGDSLYGVRLSPRAAIMYLPSDRTTIRVGYSEAFRAPSAQDLYDSDPTYVIRPSSLGAETVRAVDLEVAQRFAHGAFSVRGFASRFDGLVAQVQASPEEVAAALAAGSLVANVDPSYVTRWDNLKIIDAIGATVSGHYEPVRGLEIATNVTVATNEQGGGAGPLPTIPHLYGNTRVSYRFGDGDQGPNISLVSAWSSRRTAATEPGYTITSRNAGPACDLRLVVGAPVKSVPGLSWRLAGHTALNGRGPYLWAIGPTADAPSDPVVYGPVARLFFFAGLQYDLH